MLVPSLESLYDHFACCLRAFIRGRVEDEDTAEDILQDVFIRIHAHIHELRDENHLEGWMYSIARRAIIDHYRSRKVTGELLEDLPDEDPRREEEPDAAMELAGSLREMVEALPEPYREALLLTEFGNLTQVEMAEKLGISLSGAKSRVQRGRQKIKDLLMQCCHFEFDRYGRVVEYWQHCCCCEV
jgi:RNA polymerase sigma-70 factor, ECF subfamily